MRNALVEALMDEAERDPRLMLLTADLGWNVVDRFASRFPDRFLNVGVAEANMAGIAAGLALEGHVPFVYSIATFASMRCYEQMRNGAILHRLPVRFIGIGGGYAYGHAGPTHYALEDLSITRTQPGLTVLAPADPGQTRAVVRGLATLAGPAYIRVGKGGNPTVPGLEGRFAFGRPEIVREGADVLFVACGAIVHEALEAASLLERDRISASVAVMAHLPFRGTPELIELLRPYRHVITVEEGFTAGGLGSLIAETVVANGLATRVDARGIASTFAPYSGSEAFMRSRAGLDAVALAEAGRALVSLPNSRG